MSTPVLQPSLAAGELSPQLLARVDLAKYHSGVALMRNFFVDYRGGAPNRPGTIAVGRCKAYNHFAPPRLIPFQFSTVQSYALEFGNLYMRVVYNTGGGPGYVLEPSFALTAITNANPGVLTAVGSNFAPGDQLFIGGVTGISHINSTLGYQFIVTAATPDTFSATDLDGNVIDTTFFGAYTGGGTVARVFTLVTPYLSADLPRLKYKQSADVMTLTHPNYAPMQLTRTQHWAWTLTAMSFVPTMPTPTAVITLFSVAGATVYQYQVTATSGNTGQESLPSIIASSGGSAVMSTTAGARINLTWTGVAGAVVYRVYRTAEYQGTTPPVGALFGFIGSANGTAFIDENITPDFTQTPPLDFNPFAASNNPSESAYFQGRQWFGGSSAQPLTFWASKSGDFLNMGYSQPTRANDSIIESLFSEEVNAIRHMVPMNSLIILTAKGAWRVDGGTQSDTVTPNAIQAVPQAFSGASHVPPLKINYDILYVQEKGQTVRDLAYNFYVNVYTGAEVSFLASHLFFGHEILQWCWAEEPYKLVWAIREDGIALTFTSMKEQEVYGWAQQYTTNGLFQSCCSITEGQEDAVYFIIERLINGKYLQFTERLASRNFQGDVALAWFLDCALQRTLTYPAANLTPTALTGNGTLGTPVVIYGGSGYTAPVGQIVDQNGGAGTGATISFTVGGGVITGATVLGGTGYVQPVVVIDDATGTGASVVVPVLNLVTMNADAAVFTGAEVGRTVRVNGGIGVVVSVPLATQLIVNISQHLTSLWPSASGVWSCTAPVTTISGLGHLVGATVGILSDGNVQAQQVVAGDGFGDGSITLAQPGTLITVGIPYRCQIQSMPAEFPDPNHDVTIQSKRKVSNVMNLKVYQSRGLKAGPDFDTLNAIKDRPANTPMGVPTPLFTGDQRVIIMGGYTTAGQLCVQQDDPVPATVLAMIPEFDVGDDD